MKNIWIDQLIEAESMVIFLALSLLNNNVWEQEVMPYEKGNKKGMILMNSVAM